MQAVKMAQAALALGNSAADAADAGSSASSGDTSMAHRDSQDQGDMFGECADADGGECSGNAHMLEQVRRLKAELHAERSKVTVLEKHLEALNTSHSSQRSDAEPQGSQESPVRCLAQVRCCVRTWAAVHPLQTCLHAA